MNFGNNFLTVQLVLLKGRLSNWRCLVGRAALAHYAAVRIRNWKLL